MSLIVVQAGHYRRTTGATGTGGLDGDPTEQEFNIVAAQACVEEIEKLGHRARLIWADVPDESYRGDGFVAIHCDGSTSRSARGASVGYRNNAGHDFAQAWKKAYYDEGWRGFRPDNYTAALAGYYGVKHAVNVGNSVAFIAEAGFLTSPEDEALLSLPEGPHRFARAVAKAVKDVFGSTVKPQPEEDVTTPAQMAELKAHIDGRLLRMMSFMLTGKGNAWINAKSKGLEWVDDPETITLNEVWKEVTGTDDDIDDAAVVSGILAGISAKTLATVIPSELADQVIEELRGMQVNVTVTQPEEPSEPEN
jgi:hypothetical protein